MGNVPETEAFERKPPPCICGRLVVRQLPEHLHVLLPLGEELEVEEGEIVNELVDGVLFYGTHNGVSAYETAFFEFPKAA